MLSKKCNGLSESSVFEGGQQFQCEIGLFRKLPGTDLYSTSQVTPEVELDLEEEVQLRSIVRAGDGWKSSRITTIIIQKVGNSRARSLLSAADLVFADGCRNPSYKVIAKNHPKRSPTNPLINNFDFRMFMFQDMLAGDCLVITANVIGCIDDEDCAPANCGSTDDEDPLGYGRRKRDVGEFSHNKHNTTKWERNLSVRVKVPDGNAHQEFIEAKECQLYLFITLGVAAVFCVSSIIFVTATFFRNRIKTVPCSPAPITFISQPPAGHTLQDLSGHSDYVTEDSTSVISGSPLRDFSVPPTYSPEKTSSKQ
ncbi:hypothetical protein Pmani_002966 [Petrolisthes manimaculis]|uniref:ZP domain-containing protein n=1 Tax=Petrolisthes manimaculis TaxID=1843537 RepID=A0AAE1QJF5_9EUCA|nr:hypothetical protein Pmani_002966 [Petrolisthes manimaculis]